MKIDQDPFAQAHELFYDKSIEVLSPIVTTDNIGHVSVAYKDIATLPANVQPSSSNVMQREFGKVFDNSLRLSFKLYSGNATAEIDDAGELVINSLGNTFSLISKNSFIKFDEKIYSISAFSLFETYGVAMISLKDSAVSQLYSGSASDDAGIKAELANEGLIPNIGDLYYSTSSGNPLFKYDGLNWVLTVDLSLSSGGVKVLLGKFFIDDDGNLVYDRNG